MRKVVNQAECNKALYTLELCARAQVEGKEKRRYAPSPLSTLELQKKATQALRIGGDEIMKHAEALYQRGLISYPRTETDMFEESIDVMARSLCCCLRAHP